MGDAIVRAAALTKFYGRHRGIVGLDLDVERGEVFGFLGPNGAGKTTTIRILLDLIRPTSGRAFVFGIESRSDPAAIHRRVGYLPGEFTLYDRLTGGETLRYFENLRGGVDRTYQAQLVERFELDPSRPFREYSKGNKQKVGLIVALQHQPELLILDEPTAGLDPLVQQTFFEILREAKHAGRTVFLSSHVLSEVEKTCDRVAIVRDGRLARVDRVDVLRDLAEHYVELRFAVPVDPALFAAIPSVTKVVSGDHNIRLHVSGALGPVVAAAASLPLVDFTSREPSLEETFLAEYGRQTAGEAGHAR